MYNNDVLTMITSVAFSPDILPHFLTYYSKIGYKRFLITVYHSPNDEISQKVIEYCKGYDCAYIFTNTNGYVPQLENNTRRAWQNYAQTLGWIGIADIDEFHEYPYPIYDMIRKLEEGNFDWLPGKLIDRVSNDGGIPQITNAPLEEQFPQRMEFTDTVITHDISKVTLLRNYLVLCGGHHVIENARPYHTPIPVSHFKWYKGVIEHSEEMKRAIKEYGSNHSINYLHFLNHMKIHGKITIDGI